MNKKILIYPWLVYKLVEKKIQQFQNQMENFVHYQNFKKSNSKIGKNVKFGKNVNISGYQNIKIGNNVHIGTGAFIRGEGGLEIEDNVIISRNVLIYTTSHNYQGKLLPFDDEFIKSSVIIKKNTWIGMNCTISPGTTIGEGVIVGLGSRIFGNIPDLAIVGSENPKIIKFRDYNHYKYLNENHKYAKENGVPLNENINE